MSAESGALDAATVAAAVGATDFNRLLGMPRHRPLEGLLAERADEARAWYAAHGRPWLHASRHAILAVGADVVELADGHRFASRGLVALLRTFDAHAVLAIAVSAGPEVDEACARLWQDGKPDEAWFLERFGVAVVEYLIQSATIGGCRQASAAGETITPHLSPGCGDWDLGGQRVLWQAVFPAGASGPIRLLDSGALEPKNSLLAAAGITRRVVEARPADACRRCDLPRCTFRRAAWRGEA